jgi:hypothetical protein
LDLGNRLRHPYTALRKKDDDAVTTLLSGMIGIPENRTAVPVDSSRASFEATVQHTYYYLFQRQVWLKSRLVRIDRGPFPYHEQTGRDVPLTAPLSQVLG